MGIFLNFAAIAANPEKYGVALYMCDELHIM